MRQDPVLPNSIVVVQNQSEFVDHYPTVRGIGESLPPEALRERRKLERERREALRLLRGTREAPPAVEDAGTPISPSSVRTSSPDSAGGDRGASSPVVSSKPPPPPVHYPNPMGSCWITKYPGLNDCTEKANMCLAFNQIEKVFAPTVSPYETGGVVAAGGGGVMGWQQYEESKRQASSASRPAQQVVPARSMSYSGGGFNPKKLPPAKPTASSARPATTATHVHRSASFATPSPLTSPNTPGTSAVGQISPSSPSSVGQTSSPSPPPTFDPRKRVFKLPHQYIPTTFVYPRESQELYDYFVYPGGAGSPQAAISGATFGAGAIPDHLMRKRTMIVKPADGSQGEGIYLIQRYRDVEVKASRTNEKPSIVQKYISRPLLLGGLKFDLRIYVVLVGLGSGATGRTRGVFASRSLSYVAKLRHWII